MNRQILENSGVSYAEGLNRFSDNVALYEKFLTKFLLDETMSACCNAIAVKNYANAASSAHALKGVAGNLSMTRLHLACDMLVVCLRHGDFCEVESLFLQVQTDYNQVVLAISAE